MNATERERLFTALFHQYRERILRLCHGYLGSPAEAEDLFQEIMTRAWNGLPGFRGDAAAATWLYRIAVNSALLYRRKIPSSMPLPEVADRRPTASDALERRERLAALRTAIAALPEQDRLIATLLLEGLSYKEIAEITGISVNYVGVKISRIKQTLEKSLRELKYGNL